MGGGCRWRWRGDGRVGESRKRGQVASHSCVEPNQAQSASLRGGMQTNCVLLCLSIIKAVARSLLQFHYAVH